MSQFIGTSMRRGFAGAITRGYYDFTTEVLKNDATTPVASFGVAVKLNATNDAVTPVTASADTVAGIAVREYGQVDASGAQVPGFVTVLKRGYIAVVLAAGEAVRDGQVYLAANGAFTAETSGTALTGAKFMGPADADGLVEIAFNI